MFITYNLGGYENNTIGAKLRYIDSMEHDGNVYGGIQRYSTPSDSPNNSMYGRVMVKEIGFIKKFIQDVDREIKETQARIQYYMDSGKMGGQRETELRTLKQGYLKMKMDAFKTRTSLHREIDKAKKEELKLLKDLTGSVDNLPEMNPNGHSSDKTFMTSMFGSPNDVLTNISIPQSNIIDPASVIIPPTKSVVPTETVIQPSKQAIPENPIEELNKVQTNPASNEQISGYIKNINGEDVPIYNDLPEDFVTGEKQTYTDAKLSYENIALSRNPNVTKVFKFNENEGMGWLTFYNTEQKKEIKGQGTVFNIQELYPFKIDKQNSIVTTKIRESFPIMYTDETPLQEIKDEYERLKKIEEIRLENQE